MQVLKDTSIDDELIVTSQITMSGEIIVNSNIFVEEDGHLIIRGATLYFDQDCGIRCKGLFEAFNTTFDAKRLNWEIIALQGNSSSKSLLKNCSILNGGSLYISRDTSDVVIDSCMVTACKDTKHRLSAISSLGKNITIRNCKISECESTDKGGGISLLNGTSVEKCIIHNCKAPFGGGIFMGGGQITDCKIEECYAEHEGGGVTCEKVDSKSALSIESSAISECKSYHGGGISVKDCKVSFNDVEIIECTATSNGGGMHIGYDAEVKSYIPSKIIRCKSKGEIFSGGNAIYEDPQGCETKLDNFVFIDCIEDLNSEKEELISMTTTWGGTVKINNCKAYNSLSNGEIKEYEIEDYVDEYCNAYIIYDGEDFNLREKKKQTIEDDILEKENRKLELIENTKIKYISNLQSALMKARQYNGNKNGDFIGEGYGKERTDAMVYHMLKEYHSHDGLGIFGKILDIVSSTPKIEKPQSMLEREQRILENNQKIIDLEYDIAYLEGLSDGVECDISNLRKASIAQGY